MPFRGPPTCTFFNLFTNCSPVFHTLINKVIHRPLGNLLLAFQGLFEDVQLMIALRTLAAIGRDFPDGVQHGGVVPAAE